MLTLSTINYNLCFDDETGEEDLEGTFIRAVGNLRILVERYDHDFREAVDKVTEEMCLTYQERERLLEGAIKKYSVQ